MDRAILHSDLNTFYASVECLDNPEIKNLPVAVCGDPEERRGIVLTRNDVAKRFGISTGQAIWEAKRLCPNIVIVRPNYSRYLEFSRLVRQIYNEYTDQVESFGIDENWMDVTGSQHLFGSGEKIANTIRKRVYSELGLTVSIGVSFNKVFAKLGSDMKKPNATTVISKENFKEKVWPLPVTDLLFVGRATGTKLKGYGIRTIGELAKCKEDFLCGMLGKVGIVLSNFANGRDDAEVLKNGEEGVIKSISNSTTTPKDLVSLQDVWLTIVILSESVASRLRESGLKCTTVQIALRDKTMIWCERQGKTAVPTYLSSDIANLAMDIFKTKYKFTTPLRCVSVRACGLVPENSSVQLSMFYDHEKQLKYENMEKCIDKIRERYGHFAVQRGSMFLDKKLTAENPKEHIIYPVGVFNGPMV